MKNVTFILLTLLSIQVFASPEGQYNLSRVDVVDVSGESELGPLEKAFKVRALETNESNLTNPKELDTEALGRLVAKIYNCTEDGVIPCDEIQGDKNYQVGVVAAYVTKLEKGSFEYILAFSLFLKLKYNGTSMDIITNICKRYPAGTISGCP